LFPGHAGLGAQASGPSSTCVGYSGDVSNATNRSSGTLAEAFEAEFAPVHASFRALLEFFVQIHDPHRLAKRVTTVA
jgi:peptide-methionine (S)-S-oxide reductase